MKKMLKTGLLAAAMLAAADANAARTVVDFEGIPSWGTIEDFVYGGMSGWNHAGGLGQYSTNSNPQPDMGDQYFSAYPSGGELSFDLAPVIFEGMYYKSRFSDSQASYDLYYQNQLVYRAPLIDPENQPADIYWLASGYSGLVDKIYFYGSSDGNIVDNLTYSTAAPVPLPGAVWLFGSALAGLMLRVRRSRIG